MPGVTSVLEMPSFNVVTPQYNEAVIYSKSDFLTAVNRHGVSPMVYLKSLHALEWANFLERLGVRNETEAWKAARDAQGQDISGEMEVRGAGRRRRDKSQRSCDDAGRCDSQPGRTVNSASQCTRISPSLQVRLWASLRGQTLARTVHGVLEYARAIRLLATLQLEIEYAALAAEASAPLGADGGAAATTAVVPASRAELELDAARAAQWFTAERFCYMVCAQRYYEHGEGEGEGWKGEGKLRRAPLLCPAFLAPALCSLQTTSAGAATWTSS
jgi:hypothetical protein